MLITRLNKIHIFATGDAKTGEILERERRLESLEMRKMRSVRRDITSLLRRLALAAGGLLDDVVQHHHVCKRGRGRVSFIHSSLITHS